jgi:hypothetical protein
MISREKQEELKDAFNQVTEKVVAAGTETAIVGFLVYLHFMAYIHWDKFTEKTELPWFVGMWALPILAVDSVEAARFIHFLAKKLPWVNEAHEKEAEKIACAKSPEIAFIQAAHSRAEQLSSQITE